MKRMQKADDFAPWHIVHLDLSLGVPTLALPAGHGVVYAVFWWRDIPLGHRAIPAEQCPVSSARLADWAASAIAPAVGAHLDLPGFQAHTPATKQLEAEASVDWVACTTSLTRLSEKTQLRSSGEAVSVVVCTRDRPEVLAACLGSLNAMRVPPLEIVVVDNAPTSDATRRLVESTPGVRYVREDRPGLSVARNAGIYHTHGEIVAFTDDDATVHPDWVARLAQTFEDRRVMAMTGLGMVAQLETRSQLEFESRNSFNQGYRSIDFDRQFFGQSMHRGTPAWHVGAGVNMAWRREAFTIIGGFDERLGPGASGCGDDSELWYRLLAIAWERGEDWVCRYEPTAVVYHTHRREPEALRSQMYQYMRGHVAALLVQSARHGHRGNLYRLCYVLPRFYAQQLAYELRRLTDPRTSLRWLEVAGCLSGLAFYWQHRHERAYPSLNRAERQVASDIH